jgi:hypothetical protein
MKLTRRQFLALAGAGLVSRVTKAGDWESESPLARQIREYLESIFAGQSMGLDFRRINAQHDEEFRIQINAFNGFPVASCFKAPLILYYYYYTPPGSWFDQPQSAVYSTAVHSSNVETGTVLNMTAPHAPGSANAIEKFNNFLRNRLGIQGGLFKWDWPETPTAGLLDLRYASRQVAIRGISYTVDNVFSPADLARVYDILARGAAFARSEQMRRAILATRELLSISSPDYRSPIERVWPSGYLGKDGILPSDTYAFGRVVDDAGLIQVGDSTYLVSFMCAGQSESTALYILGEVVKQIGVYEAGG